MCYDLLSWRAARPTYHQYLKAFILIYGPFYCLTLSQDFKRRDEIAGPRRQRAPKPAWDLEAGARERRGQDTKKEEEQKASMNHKEEEGCRSICVFSSGILLKSLSVRLAPPKIKKF